MESAAASFFSALALQQMNFILNQRPRNSPLVSLSMCLYFYQHVDRLKGYLVWLQQERSHECPVKAISGPLGQHSEMMTSIRSLSYRPSNTLKVTLSSKSPVCTVSLRSWKRACRRTWS